MSEVNDDLLAEQNSNNNITVKAILLTFFYALLWFLGPIIFNDDSLMLLGLPAWFWFSCVLAPVTLVITSYFFFFRR